MFVVEELKVQFALAVPPDGTVTLDGHDTLRPVEGDVDVDKLTAPEKPPRLPRLTVVEPEPPLWNDTGLGLAEMLKSATVKETVVVTVTPLKVVVLVALTDNTETPSGMNTA